MPIRYVERVIITFNIRNSSSGNFAIEMFRRDTAQVLRFDRIYGVNPARGLEARSFTTLLLRADGSELSADALYASRVQCTFR